MAIVSAVPTSLAREVWPKMFGGLVAFSAISYFRIGEGGWENLGAGRSRRTPDASLTDLDLILDPSRLLVDRRYASLESFGYFQKTLTPGDFVFEAPTTLRVRCFLDFGEYNTKGAAGATVVYNAGGLGVSPELWELGLYDGSNRLLAYGTFPKETKDGTKQIENVVRIGF